jgi:flagellar hook-associated protein 3 FlgL
MTSYISTQSLSSLLRQSVLRMQSELASGETELATGNYADIGLELGGRTGDTVSLHAEASLLQTVTSTNQTAALRLDTTESVLSNVQGAAQDLLDSLIHDDVSGSIASTIQASGKTNLERLTPALNSSLNGDYIFAGTNTSNQPITDYYAAAAPNKAAVDSAFAAAFGMSQSSPGVSAISSASMQSFLDTQFAPLFQGSNWTANWSAASSQILTNRIPRAKRRTLR